jgi:mono/diheme cytochrome c family protein
MTLVTRVALVSAFALLLLDGGMSAQQPPRPTTAAAAVDSGKKLFMQRCSVCHMPPLGPGEPSSYAKSLAGVVKNKEAEAAAREIIQKGLPTRMPGFQYGLTSTDIDHIVAYLSTLK